MKLYILIVLLVFLLLIGVVIINSNNESFGFVDFLRRSVGLSNSFKTIKKDLNNNGVSSVGSGNIILNKDCKKHARKHDAIAVYGGGTCILYKKSFKGRDRIVEKANNYVKIKETNGITIQKYTKLLNVFIS